MEVLGRITGFIPRFLIGDLDDVHIYDAHLGAVTEQLTRQVEDQPTRICMPKINSLDDLDDLTAADFSLENYHPMTPIKAPLLVG